MAAPYAADPGEAARDYEVVLMTDGDWTCPDMVGQACDENPAQEAAALQQDGVRVHVVAFGDATMQPSLNEVALQTSADTFHSSSSIAAAASTSRRIAPQPRSCTRKRCLPPCRSR